MESFSNLSPSCLANFVLFNVTEQAFNTYDIFLGWFENVF